MMEGALDFIADLLAGGGVAAPVPLSPTNDPIVTGRGVYHANFDDEGGEQIINVPGRPVQPQITRDISVVDPADTTQLAQIAHGGLVLDMTSTYTSGVDPVYAPGTGTPEIGGFTTHEAQRMIRGLEGLNLIGGDVVEVAPPLTRPVTRH